MFRLYVIMNLYVLGRNMQNVQSVLAEIMNVYEQTEKTIYFSRLESVGCGYVALANTIFKT